MFRFAIIAAALLAVTNPVAAQSAEDPRDTQIRQLRKELEKLQWEQDARELNAMLKAGGKMRLVTTAECESMQREGSKDICVIKE